MLGHYKQNLLQILSNVCWFLSTSLLILLVLVLVMVMPLLQLQLPLSDARVVGTDCLDAAVRQLSSRRSRFGGSK